MTDMILTNTILNIRKCRWLSYNVRYAISKNCINCPALQILHSFRTAGRALDIKRKITFIHRFSLAPPD